MNAPIVHTLQVPDSQLQPEQHFVVKFGLIIRAHLVKKIVRHAKQTDILWN